MMKQYLNFLVLIVLITQSSGCASKGLSDAFKQVDPSVVVIHTADSKQFATDKGTLMSNTEQGLGSGVIISADGKILTAAHVVQTADKLSVKLNDGRQFLAKVLSSAPFADLALIKLIEPPANLSPSKMGNSDEVEVGDPVFVIGTPYGIEHTLTAGYISGIRNSGMSPLGDPIELLQTDAAINKGNSGGPIFSFDGELIGIVSHIKSASGGNEGLGFASSINMAKTQLLEKPAFWSGIELVPVQGRLAKALNIPLGAGFIVQSVAQGSVGNRLGLRASTVPITFGDVELLIGGDIITRIGEQNVYLTKEGLIAIMQRVGQFKIEGKLQVTVLRDGKELELSTKLLLD